MRGRREKGEGKGAPAQTTGGNAPVGGGRKRRQQLGTAGEGTLGEEDEAKTKRKEGRGVPAREVAAAVAGGRRCDGGGRGEWGRCVVGERGCEKERKGCKKVREEEQAQPCAGREKPDPRTAVREGTGSRACLLGEG